ncbi:MAG TPA: response regulator [Longimicrobium sp.]
MPGKTVLLVDTHEDSRAIYATILKHHGFGVLAAAFHAEGVRLARERLPDLIVLEYGLPRSEALEAAHALRSDALTGTIPLLALSTAFSEADRERALAAGFSAYLLKPCPPLQLLAETRRLLGMRLHNGHEASRE